MGSLFGVTFGNYYMHNQENSIFEAERDLKPAIYCCYIDDIFILTQSEDRILSLWIRFNVTVCFNLRVYRAIIIS